MNHWWRAYDEAVDNPKLLLLSDRTHRAWFGLMCLASANGGRLPERKVIELKLRLSPSKTAAVLTELKAAVLIDEDETGLIPHNWNGRQYKSDVSTERVKRFRNGQRNVSETPPDNRLQITDSERKKDVRSVAGATRTPSGSVFEEFWKTYPRRKGSNPKNTAKSLFDAAVKAGADPHEIIAGARKFSDLERENIGTPYIPQAVKWLRGKQWENYRSSSNTGAPEPPPGAPSDAELRKRYGRQVELTRGISPETQANSNVGGADNSEELRPKSSGFCGENQGGNLPDDQARTAGMRGLGAVLPSPPRGLPVGVQSFDDGADQGDDGPDAVARVV